MRMRRNATLALLLLCGGAAIAQDTPGAPEGSGERVLRSFARCRTLPDAAARLDCFDKAATALETSVKAKDVRIVDRQDLRRARRSLFGFTIPRMALFGGDDGASDKPEKDEFRELNTTIVSARGLENGRVELRLAEGDAVWVTTDPMPFPPKPGAKIRIRAGTLGNYFIAIAGERSVRGMRLR